jgi:hypothetical protein
MKRRRFFQRAFAGVAIGAGGVLENTLLGAVLPKQNVAIGKGGNLGNSYSRMFPELVRAPSKIGANLEKALIALGRAMIDDSHPRETQEDLPTAGYTYFGQFIDHDLTLDLTPLARAQPDASRTPNYRTPSFDLDQVYGGGPSLSPFLYRRDSQRGAERFLIGQTSEVVIEGEKFLSSENDLPRNTQALALTADPREDENLIIAQLHVAFLKLHNRIIDDLEHGHIDSIGPEDGTLFEQARRLVTWHYQWIVRHDYLRTVIDPQELEILSKRQERIRARVTGAFSIPLEFSIAAFRFGHSMVRDHYRFNRVHREVTPRDLFGRFGVGNDKLSSLPADWVISWDRFFSMAPDTAHLGHARKIDTMITDTLHDIEHHTIGIFSAPTKGEQLQPNLPAITLLRGARAGLPTGQDLAQAMDISPLSEDQIATGAHEEILRQSSLQKDTPLWYYILKEAEILSDGKHLGPLGSRIVADVIIGALAADSESYLCVAPEWQPTLIKAKGSTTFGISDLLLFASQSHQGS